MSERDYDELFIRGTNAQREKLEENDLMAGFEDMEEINEIFILMSQERDELLLEIAIYDIGLDVPGEIRTNEMNLENIRRKAADIANFAHMIILKCDKELEK